MRGVFGLCLLGALSGGAAALDDTLPLARLPAEARETLNQVQRGGPFRYDRDGIVFNNYERLLPRRSRGYYREYTVQTPGVRHRGARRLVVGCEREAARQRERASGTFDGFPDCAGPASVYYTEDHYRSFRKVVP